MSTPTLDRAPAKSQDKLVPAKRCSDYDQDCKKVKSHYLCFKGQPPLGQADGYCPFLLGNNKINEN